MFSVKNRRIIANTNGNNMNSKRLYIIGNGFDLHHDVQSRYSDFRDFVNENDSDLFEALEEYFNTDELWSDFEETLAYLDTDKIVDDASNFLVSYGADDWSDADHHDYQYEVQKAIDVVTVTLKNHFTQWILQLEIPHATKLPLPKDSKYLTFNYTNTLESNYQIPFENITYIHNKAVDENSLLILGHSRQPTPDTLFDKVNDDEDIDDVRVVEGNQILDRYFKETYKNTETIISEKQEFFTHLNSIVEVFVLGHSLSIVDLQYFKVIADNTSGDVVWTVTYRGDEQKETHLQTLRGLGIKDESIRQILMTELK